MSEVLEVSKCQEKVSNIRCELVSGDNISHLEGKIKTLIDGLGLSEKQEKAAKDLTQTILWDWFNYITDHYLDNLKEKIDWYYENKIKKDKYYQR